MRWSATGGLVDNTGFYRAGADTGSFQVTAEVNATQLTSTAYVKILPMLARIEASPESVVLKPDNTTQLIVLGYDSLNTQVKVYPVWSAQGGTINPSGLYTAGPDTGVFRITVRDSLSLVETTVAVRIVATTGVDQLTGTAPPTAFSLSQNYPNPFNPVTTIQFSVQQHCHVLLQIFDIHGRVAATLAASDYAPGIHSLQYHASDLASGVYFYRIEMGGFSDMKKMLFIK